MSQQSFILLQYRINVTDTHITAFECEKMLSHSYKFQFPQLTSKTSILLIELDTSIVKIHMNANFSSFFFFGVFSNKYQFNVFDELMQKTIQLTCNIPKTCVTLSDFNMENINMSVCDGSMFMFVCEHKLLPKKMGSNLSICGVKYVCILMIFG